MNSYPLILLVEDSPTQALELSSHLKRFGLNVMVAEDGVSGLRLVDEHRPDMVVLDVNLPKMDGFQVCRRLKRDPQTASIPVIMLTVADSSESTLTGLEAGADDYIPKDMFAVDNLIATMQSLGMEIGEP